MLAHSLDPTALFDKINDYMEHLDCPYLENKELFATTAIKRDVIVQVALGLEGFLERKEFTLTVDLHRSKDKQMWKEHRNIRIKSEKLRHIIGLDGWKILNEEQDL
jgi:hypothetical protein